MKNIEKIDTTLRQIAQSGVFFIKTNVMQQKSIKTKLFYGIIRKIVANEQKGDEL